MGRFFNFNFKMLYCHEIIYITAIEIYVDKEQNNMTMRVRHQLLYIPS